MTAGGVEGSDEAGRSMAAALDTHPLELVARILDASNAAFFGWVGDVPVVHKPVRGERPLWDFPTGCLAHREMASYLVDRAGGFGVVPATALVEGPAGPGSVQQWVTAPPVSRDGALVAETRPEDGADPGWFALLDPPDLPVGWLPVLTGQTGDGREVLLAHADDDGLRTVAVLDAVLNNSDRKGSHLLLGVDGGMWGIDHGVTFHEDPKLRTVLWGWAGETIPPADVARLRRLHQALDGPDLRERLDVLLTPAEITALEERVAQLLATGLHPVPHDGWPPVPWPAL